MKITLINNEQFETIKNIFETNKNLTFQNKGYQYINKAILTNSDKQAIKTIETILHKHIFGFNRFNNFNINKDNDIVIRLQYNYNYDNNNIPFVGVGYIKLTELLKGFE